MWGGATGGVKRRSQVLIFVQKYPAGSCVEKTCEGAEMENKTCMDMSLQSSKREYEISK